MTKANCNHSTDVTLSAWMWAVNNRRRALTHEDLTRVIMRTIPPEEAIRKQHHTNRASTLCRLLTLDQRSHRCDRLNRSIQHPECSDPRCDCNDQGDPCDRIATARSAQLRDGSNPRDNSHEGCQKPVREQTRKTERPTVATSAHADKGSEHIAHAGNEREPHHDGARHWFASR